MKEVHRFASLMLGTVLCLTAQVSAGERIGAPEPTDRVIVHFRDPGGSLKGKISEPGGLSERAAAVRSLVERGSEEMLAAFAPQGLELERAFQLQAAVAVTAPRRLMSDLADLDLVERIEPDHLWRVHTAEGRELIGATLMHRSDFTGDGTAIAVIDTGIDAYHPALGAGPIPNPKVVRGLDTGDHDDDPMDCGSHGTAVAAVAVGSSFQWNPSRWFAGGVAPQARLLAYKASPDAQCGAMSTSAVVAAIEDALLHREGPDYRLAAINISAGSGAFIGPCDDISLLYSQAVADATDLGVTVVASSGNDGESNAIAAPACFADVLSVGAFWDQEPGWTGYSFCLDAGCQRYCNDSFRPAGSVTCYTNLSNYLDVIAPSEYLTTARAGGQTLDFGGTSGAAPYVSGAIALLREANPGITPGELRIQLALTGRRRVDERTGLVVPAIRVDRARDAARVAVGPGVPGPDASSGGIAISRASFAQDIVIGAVHALVHLAHDDPERLRLTLVSPKGTRVRLHDHQPGTSTRSNAGFGGLYALYPDDVTPVDSLARLRGESARGEWSLEVVDLDPSTAPGARPQILGWGLEIDPHTTPGSSASGHRVVVPVVADVSGLNGTRWLSDLRLYAPEADDETAVRLYLVPSGADGRVSSHEAALRLPAGRVAALPDLVSQWFGDQGMVGSLVVESSAWPLQVSSRTYNSGSADGTFGQFIGAVRPEEATANGEGPLHALFLAETESYRSNLGLVETQGSPVLVQVAVVDGSSGELIAPPRSYSLGPFSQIQINRVLATVGAAGSANARAIVEVLGGDGRVAAYASLVDNRTGDAAFVPATRAEETGTTIVPVVARAAGAAGTDWSSDLRIANLGDERAVLEVVLQWRENGAMRTARRQLAIPAGAVAVHDDVVGSLLGVESAVGSLRVTSLTTPATLAVASRTYNRTSNGTFGQAVRAVSDGATGTVEVLHLDGGSGWRSNLGLVEVSGGEVIVKVELFDGNGSRIGGSKVVGLAPYELVQIDRIHEQLEAPALANCRAEIRLESGEGSFVAYGSVVDNRTGDAIWVPGVARAAESGP